MANAKNNYINTDDVVLSMKGDSSGWELSSTPPAKAKKVNDVNNIMANRYEVAYNKIYKQLPVWKRLVVDECVKNKTNKVDRVYDEFVHSVVELAESQHPLPMTLE